MEVKINREIREYTENIFFGLSMRQFIFSVFACGIAILLYFILRPYFGIETLSWVCILGAVPFAVLGFLKYNGMTAEKFIFAWIKSEILLPKHLTFKPDNLYFEMIKNIENNKKLESKKKKRNKRSKKNKKFKKNKKVNNKVRAIKEELNLDEDVEQDI